MKIIKSSPTNPKVLETYGGLLKVALLIILFCQFISTITETGVGYTFFYEKLLFLGWFGFILTVIFTIAFVALLEGGGRLLLSYAVDSILYKRWVDGLEKVLTGVIILGCLILYFTSYSVSMQGKGNVIKSFSEYPELATTRAIDSKANAEKLAVLSTYSNDSLQIASNYNNQTTGIKNEYLGKIEEKKKLVEYYDRKAKEGTKWALSHKQKNERKIPPLEIERDNKVLEKETAKGNELAVLLQERKSSIKRIEGIQDADTKKINDSNSKLTDDHESEIESNSNGLGNLIFISIPLVVIFVIVQRIIYKKAGVKVTYQFDDYFYRESVTGSWWNYVSEKVNQKVYTKIEQWTDKIPEVKLQERPTIIFNRLNNSQIVDTQKEDIQDAILMALNKNINFDDTKYQLLSEYQQGQQLQNDTLSNGASFEKKTFELLKQKNEANSDDEKAKINKQIKKVIKAFFDTDFTPSYSKKIGRKFTKDLDLYFDGIGANPFDEFLPKKRRQIGFNQNGNSRGRTGTQNNNEYHLHADKFTVPHEQNNGKTIRVGMDTIKSKINLYSGRKKDSEKQLIKAQKRGKNLEIKKHEKALSNRSDNLNYWNGKKQDLENQISNN